MNEQTNTRLVQQAYQWIHAGDMAAFLTLLADDVQWKIPAMQNVPFAGTWQGRAQVSEFFRKVPRRKNKSNLCQSTLSPKATKWWCWAVS